MAHRGALLLPLLLACCAVLAAAQPPGSVTNTEFESIGEARRRALLGYTGFVFDMFTGMRAEASKNGFQVPNAVGTNAFTAALGGHGHSTNTLNLGACAGNSPHHHPRGPEISIIVRGTIQFGFVEENAGGNRLVIVDAPAGSIVHIPQGLIHFSHNLQCAGATFVATFPTRDPGTVTTWTALMHVPTPIFAASINIRDDQDQKERIIEGWKNRTLVAAPASGGADCLRRCFNPDLYLDLNDIYQELNTLTPSVTQLMAGNGTGPIVPTDQMMNPQRFEAGGVTPPDTPRNKQLDFIGLSTIDGKAGFANGFANGTVMGKDNLNIYWRRRMLEKQRGVMSAKEMRKLSRALPNDRITVITPEEQAVNY